MDPRTNKETLRNLDGVPIGENKNSLTSGPHGLVSLADTFLLEKVMHFDREKIPPRNVHALGYGAHGIFTPTNQNIGKYTCAKIFQDGKKVQISVRFSGVFTEQGEADTVRDLRGFAIKFRTDEGNWDLLTINTPVFNCRDMKIGPDAIHAYKRDPRTGMWNPNQTWDFVAHHPEALHQALMIFTDRVGTPSSFRLQNYFSANTFSFINESKEKFWVRFHLVGEQGWEGLNLNQAKLVAGEDPNFLGNDLWHAIEKGNFPRWKLCVQIMPEEEGYQKSWAFDATKVWKHEDYPLVELGVIEINRLPVDYFTEVEQIAFSPATLIPGIGISPDKLLQGRLFVYGDTQTHRIGTNYKQLPINCPLAKPSPNYYLGGEMQLTTENKYPHYVGSVSTENQPVPNSKYKLPAMKSDGAADYYDFPKEGSHEDWYEQPAQFLSVMKDQELQNLYLNLGKSLSKCQNEVVSLIMEHFDKIDKKLVDGVKKILDTHRSESGKTEVEKLVGTIEHQLQTTRVK